MNRARPQISARIRRRMAGERGFALPTVVLLSMAAFAIGTVAVNASINANRSSTKDDASQTALTVAEAGANQALLRYNKLTTTTANPCLTTSTGGNLIATATQTSPVGWCAPVTGNVNGGTYSYRVKPATATIKIVSTGTVGGSTRRVAMAATTPVSETTTVTPFSQSSVVAKNYIFMNSLSGIYGNAAAGGTVGSPVAGKPIVMYSGSRFCGNAQIPVGTSFDRGPIISGQYNNYYGGTNCSDAGGTTTYGSVNMPDIAMPSSTDNAARFFTTATSDNAKDLYSGKAPIWNASARTLTLENGSDLTLGGSVYGFCEMTLDAGSRLNVKQGVKIYFDKPENCANTTTPLIMNRGSEIQEIQGEVYPVNFEMIFVGSPDIQQTIVVTSNTQLPKSNLQQCSESTGNNGFILYAPYAKLFLEMDAKLCGSVAVDSIWLDSRGFIYSAAGNGNWVASETTTDPGLHYSVTSFVECTATTGALPDANC